MSHLKQAESVGRGSSSCFWPRGVGTVCLPTLYCTQIPWSWRQDAATAVLTLCERWLMALKALAGFKGHPGNPLNQVQKEVQQRCLALASRWRPSTDGPSSAEAARSALLRGMSVYADNGPSNTLVPFDANLLSVLQDLGDAPEFFKVFSQVSRRFLTGEQERMQLEHGCEEAGLCDLNSKDFLPEVDSRHCVHRLVYLIVFYTTLKFAGECILSLPCPLRGSDAQAHLQLWPFSQLRPFYVSWEMSKKQQERTHRARLFLGCADESTCDSTRE